MRWGASYNTNVWGKSRQASSALRRAADFGGRKPTNANGPGSPATESAAIAAFAPGIGTTSNPAARAAATACAPGSEIAGVPASVTSATSCPASSCRDELARGLALVVLVQGGQLRRDPVMREQTARVARVLGEHDVDGAERGDRAQRDVAQITDRRGHHI